MAQLCAQYYRGILHFIRAIWTLVPLINLLTHHLNPLSLT